MVALVTLEEVKRHLRIEENNTDDDLDLADKMEEATDIIIGFLKDRADPLWTVDTVPARIRVAIVLVIADMFENREAFIKEDQYLSKAVQALIWRDRDPALA